jgi:hypothetical protein
MSDPMRIRAQAAVDKVTVRSVKKPVHTVHICRWQSGRQNCGDLD